MSLYVALSCPIGQHSIWETFLCSGRCAACRKTLLSPLCVGNSDLVSFSCTFFFETVKLIIQLLYLILYLILRAGINCAWLVYQYSIYQSLIFPVWAVGKFSMNKDLYVVSSLLPSHVKRCNSEGNMLFWGNLFNWNFDPNVDGNSSKTRHKPGWAHMLLKCFCCMCQIIQLTCIYVDSSNNLKTAEVLLFFNKNTVLERKNI